MSGASYLDVAEAIATALCRDAVRDGDRCNWLGDAMETINGQMRAVHRSFRGDLYGGTAGIALFLAETDRFRPDPLIRRTARAAIEHALRDAPAISLPLGFYSGANGIGYAAMRIGELIDDPALIDRGLALLEQYTAVDDSSPVDIVSGAAGIIGPLLALHRRFGRDWMIDRALAAGDLILRRARKSDRGLSWDVLGEAWATADLTGYGHGTAGIAVALSDLARLSGESRFLAGVEGALQYERSWYSAEHQNWPDFRRAAGGTATPSAAGYSHGWCHGAPGIGLSRLRLTRFQPRDDTRDEALAALRGTYTPLSTLAPTAMFALCHGAAGNAELFLDAGEILGDPGHTAIAEAIGQQGIERFHTPRRPWPCGLTSGGETPGLMLGLAGIGYFYLRLHDRKTVPSLLLVGPDA